MVRWYLHWEIDRGDRCSATNEETAGNKELKADIRSLEDEFDILRRATLSTAAYYRSLVLQRIDHGVYQGSWTGFHLTRGWVCGPKSKEVLTAVQG